MIQILEQKQRTTRERTLEPGAVIKLYTRKNRKRQMSVYKNNDTVSVALQVLLDNYLSMSEFKYT